MESKEHVPFCNGRVYGTFQGNSKNEKAESISEKKPMVAAPKFKVDRYAMTQVKLDTLSPPFYDEDNTFPKKVHSMFRDNFSCSCTCLIDRLKKIFPVFRWLPEYSIRNDLTIDIITGFTLLILHVPQGMAYAQLACVPPIYGLYTSFYPVLIYFLLGTSKHVSIGTFAVSSLLTGTKVLSVTRDEYIANKFNLDTINLMSNATLTSAVNATVPPLPSTLVMHSHIQIAMIITFTVGILQTAMGLLRLGYLTTFMSDEMISAFISGTVIHVFTSQLKPLTGATFEVHSGVFNIILTWIEMFKHIGTLNSIVLLISLCSLTFLIVVKEVVNAFLSKHTKIPIPAELILVIIGTVVSYFENLHENWEVAVVGPTPTGLHPPDLPAFELLPKIFPSSMVLAIVCATTTLSMVIIYAKKHEYEVDTSQELIAYGVGGIFSSFFYCIPSCGSLSRSAVQESSGAKSQVVSLVSSILMLVVLLAVGPLFETLPSCVLSAVIIMSLKSMLLHFCDFVKAWKSSKLDASVWMVTFLSVVLLDMDYGLIIGIVFSLVTILFRSQYPDTSLLGNLLGTEIYRSADKYPNVSEIPGVKIFHFGASLYFGNRDYFRSQLFHLVSSQQSPRRNRVADAHFQNSMTESRKSVDAESQLSFSKSYKEDELLKVVVIELSAAAYVDSGGADTLLQVIREFAVNKIAIYLACVQEPVMESLKSHGFFNTFNEEFVFPTVHDAVLYAKKHENCS